MLHFYDLISGLVPCYFAFVKKQDEAYKIFCFPTWTFWLGKGKKKKIRCAAAVYYVTFFFFPPVEKVLIPFLFCILASKLLASSLSLQTLSL